jgi:PKD repeat protein
MKNVFQYFIVIIFINLITINSYSQNSNAYRVKITGNGYSDETVIRLVNGATLGFDGMYDAWKLISPNPNAPSIYTQIVPGQILSINSLPEFTDDNSVTIYTNIPVSGSYTVELEEIYTLSANYKISLTEIVSNTHTRISGDTVLVFNFNAQQNSPTFTFNFSTPLVYTVTDESCTAMNDGSLEVNNAGNNDWDIEIIDSNTNIVLSNTSISNINSYDNMSPGSYTAKISSLGIEDEINFNVNSAINLTAEFDLDKDTVYLSEGGEVNITNHSQNALNYSWDMGDGGTMYNINPTYAYTSVGVNQITLTSANTNCTTQSTKLLTVLLSPPVIASIKGNNEIDFKLTNVGNGNYKLTTADLNTKKINIYDVKGSLIYTADFSGNNCNLSLTNNNSGIYILNVIAQDGKIFQKKLIK